MPTRPPSHSLGETKRTRATERQTYDRQRGSAAARGYDATWRKIRAAVLRREPLCRFCTERGVTTAASEVDHIDGNPWNRASDNLRPLCKPCHSRRTAHDQGFHAKPKHSQRPA